MTHLLLWGNSYAQIIRDGRNNIMALYPLLLLTLLVQRGVLPWMEILCPALTLASTVVLRRMLPRPRPFEVFRFEPLLDHRCGGSFPSRHSASALAIAMAAVSLHPLAGAVLVFLALLIGASRILTGLHFPRDVFSGYGLALFWSIPLMLSV